MRIIICKARRAGLSTGVGALIYDDTTSIPNTKSLIVANQSSPGENVLGMYTEFWRNTPESMTVEGRKIKIRPDLPPAFRNNPPADKLFFDKPLDSKIYIASAKALDAYLSFGFQNIHATEASRYVDASETFRELYSTLSIESDSSLYIESTPNGQEGRGAWFHQQVMDANANKKSEIGQMALVFVPWHEMRYSFSIPFANPDKKAAFAKSLNPDERDILKRFPYVSLEQLAWRRMMLAGPGFRGDEEKFEQEFPSSLAECFLMSGVSVFSRRTIKRLMTEHVRPPIWEGDIFYGDNDRSNEGRAPHHIVREPHFRKPWQAKEEGRESHTNERTYKNLRVWRWPKKGDRLFICCDVGAGKESTVDGDYSTMVVSCLNELERDEVIMSWRGHLNPVKFAEVASAFAWALRRLVGDAVVAPLLAPEWTGPGTAMCVYIDTKNLYPNLYRYQAPGVHKMPSGRHIGWESNTKSVNWAMGVFRRMVDSNMIEIPDERIVTEMAHYRQKDDLGDEASFGGSAGRHDDFVSTLRINCALMRRFEQKVPGDDEPIAMEDNITNTEGLPSWDPWQDAPVVGMPGVTMGDLGDDEDQEQQLWWAS